MPVPGRNVEQVRAVIRERIVESAEGCWLWQGALNQDGYGWLRASGISKSRMAHTLSYVAFVGDVPEGEQIHHTCENQSCVNPYHLVAVDDESHRDLHRSPTCSAGHDDWGMTSSKGRPHRYCRTCNLEKSRASYYRRKSLSVPSPDSSPDVE